MAGATGGVEFFKIPEGDNFLMPMGEEVHGVNFLEWGGWIK